MTCRRGSLLFVALAALLVLPAVAHAQSAMTGTVKDASGAVLPGVTVEASSDALIEKSKVGVTDGEGRYLITDLRPGSYVVTFSLTGFSTIRREGITLPSEFTMTLNADLRIGALEESITVTGDAPVVDVTTAVHTSVLNREAIDAIPTGRTIQGMGQLIVGINLSLPDTGGARSMQQTYMSTHGMSAANNTVLVDGMMVNGLQGDGAIQSYFNDAMNQEVSYQTAGIGAETQAGGVRLNMIPREGGNRFSGDFKAAYRPGDWQGSNLTQRHLDKGLTAGNATDRIIDYTFAQGGPVIRDKLWFFGSARYYSVNNFIAGSFYEDGSQAIDDQFIKSGLLRMTWQITSKTKFSGYFDEVDKFRGHDLQSGYDPATAATVWNSPAYHTATAKLTNTLTSRLLLEGGWSNNTEYYTNSYLPGIEKGRWTPDWYATTMHSESDIAGFQRRGARTPQTTQSPKRHAANASMSYVTGSHNIKVGLQSTWGTFYHTTDGNADLTQGYQSGTNRAGGTGVPFTRPATVTVYNTPVGSAEALDRDLGIYAQDSWNVKRLTVNAGIRYEKAVAHVMGGYSPAGRFVPERQFEEILNTPNWSDWAPRFALVYDLFGNAKTALKYSINRYNRSVTTGVADDYNPLGTATATLPWTDLNGDNIAQGDSQMVNGVRQSCTYLAPGCEIDFGNLNSTFGVQDVNEYGGFPRTWNLEQGLELQHELMPRLSLTGSWFHGDFYDLNTTINRALQFDGDPALNPHFTPFTVYNPETGEAITAYGLKTASRPAVNPDDELDTFDPNRKTIYNAFNLEFKARPGAGAQIFGGISFEREIDVNCTVPDNPNSLRFCDEKNLDIPYKKNVKLAGSYPLPWGVTFSAALQSNIPDTSTRVMTFTTGQTRYPVNCAAPCPANTVIVPRTVANQTTMTVALVPGPAVLVERITQLDIKLAKTIRFGRVSVLPTFEAFNINNSDAIISYQSTNILSGQYLAPNSIMQPRMIGVGATVRW
jgi:Carboxypeptidase regulatory-like domain